MVGHDTSFEIKIRPPLAYDSLAVGVESCFFLFDEKATLYIGRREGAAIACGKSENCAHGKAIEYP